MMRYARVATMWLVITLCAGAVSAQTPAATPGSNSRFYVEVNGGATLGHKSDKSVGGEGGMRVGNAVDVFIEGGHIGNAATTDFEQRGQKIATAVGASISAVEKVNYFDAGVRYHAPATPMVHPYVAFGVGVAQVKTESNLSVNGTVVSPDSLGVLLGTDLSGTSKRPFIMIGVGTNIMFAKRFFADLSYRYGRISQETSDADVVLASVPTQRVQIGIGIRF